MKKYILQFKFKNLLHIFLIACNSAFLVGASVTLAFMTNQLVAGNFKLFLIWLGIEISLYLLYLVFTYIINIHQAKLIQEMSLKIRSDYIKNITNSSFHTFQSKTIGDHISILNNDIQIIENSGFSNLYNLFSTLFTSLFSIIALLSYDIRIVVLTILLTICLTYLPKPFATKMQNFMSIFSTANEELVSGLNDQLSGYKTLYYSNKKPTLLIQTTKIIRNYITQKVNFTQNSTRIEIIMSIFSIIAQMSILFLTGLLITLGQVSIGSISSVGQISGNIFNSLTTLNQLQVAIHSVKPLFLKFEISSKNTEKKIVNNIENIDICDLEYNFGNKKIFSKFNLNLIKNKKYAILGESGSGKSTLINIILGNLQNYTGHVKYNNLELKEIDENSIISQVAYISNSTHIYNDTLENNLTLWSQDITPNEIKKALKDVNLLDLLGRLKEKVSNDLLSEGQKQRIGIARALLKGSKIIIMDEATANLDKTNSDFIENNLLKNPDITYITVTHHLSSEREKYFDQIIKLA